MKTIATRYHDISCGHRVVGHEGKCRHFHGHNYRIHFTVEADFGLKPVDAIGRVLDFTVIKTLLCEWLESNWDHKMLLWKEDQALAEMQALDPAGVVALPFNPTAENMAAFLLNHIGPQWLPAGTRLCKVLIEETAKCHAGCEL